MNNDLFRNSFLRGELLHSVLWGAVAGSVIGYPGFGVMMGFFLGVFWRLATKVEGEETESAASFYGKI